MIRYAFCVYSLENNTFNLPEHGTFYRRDVSNNLTGFVFVFYDNASANNVNLYLIILANYNDSFCTEKNYISRNSSRQERKNRICRIINS